MYGLNYCAIIEIYNFILFQPTVYSIKKQRKKYGNKKVFSGMSEVRREGLQPG